MGEGDPGGAIVLSNRLIARRPYDEGAVRQLMGLHLAADDRGGALRAYDALVARLARDLELHPSAETSDLAEAVRNGGETSGHGQTRNGPSITTQHAPSVGGTDSAEPGVGHGASLPSSSPPTHDPPGAEPRQSGSPTPSRSKHNKRGWWAAGFVALLGLLFAWPMLATPPRDASGLLPDARPRVAVPPLQNLTGDPAWDRLGVVASHAASSELASTGLVEVYPADHLLAEIGDPQTPAPAVEDWARESGTRYLVRGSYHTRVSDLVMEVRITDLNGGVLLAAIPEVVAPSADAMTAVNRIVSRIAGTLALHLDPTHEYDFRGSTPSLAAFNAFVDASEHTLQGEWSAAEDDLRQAIQFDSSFVDAYWVLGTAALWNQQKWSALDSLVVVMEGRFHETGPVDRARLDNLRWSAANQRERALAAIREAANITGGMDRFVAGIQSVQLNRAHEAIYWLEGMDRDRGVVRRWQPYWAILGAAYHLAGRYEDELTTAEEARVRFASAPGSPLAQWYAPRFMAPHAALGRPDTVEAHVARALDRGWYDAGLMGARALRAFGYLEASKRSAGVVLEELLRNDTTSDIFSPLRRAEAFSLSGRHAESLEVYRDLMERFPMRADLLGQFGVAAARAGEVEEAGRTALQLQQWDEPYQDGKPLAWSARIHAALGDTAQAVRLLEGAFREGLQVHPAAALFGGDQRRAVGIWPATEWVFENVRGVPEFEALVTVRDSAGFRPGG